MKKKYAALLPVALVLGYIVVDLSKINFRSRLVGDPFFSGSDSQDPMFYKYSVVLFISNIVVFFIFYYLAYFKLKHRRRATIPSAIILLIAFFIPSFLGSTNLNANMDSILSVIPSAIGGGLLYLVYDWYNKSLQKKELEKKNTQSELALLKNQINPHFLFNTLNNIDSLIQSNQKKASAMLVGLSDMMRYMIYDTNTDKVSLQDELAYIRNYMSLQQIQYANPNLACLDVDGNPANIKIAPMLFIPFIENAFKHCTNKTIDDAIRFKFNISSNIIHFESVNIVDRSQHISKDKSSGVGLELVKRRLALLYPRKHSLVITEQDNYFRILLNIDSDD